MAAISRGGDRMGEINVPVFSHPCQAVAVAESGKLGGRCRSAGHLDSLGVDASSFVTGAATVGCGRHAVVAYRFVFARHAVIPSRGISATIFHVSFAAVSYGVVTTAIPVTQSPKSGVDAVASVKGVATCWCRIAIPMKLNVASTGPATARYGGISKVVPWSWSVYAVRAATPSRGRATVDGRVPTSKSLAVTSRPASRCRGAASTTNYGYLESLSPSSLNL